MKFYNLFSFFFLLIVISFKAQISFRGIILDENNKPLNRARVLIKSEKTSKYIFTDTKGIYIFKFQKFEEETAYLIASYTSYESDTASVSVSKNKLEYNVNFILTKSSKKIQDVVIQGKRKPFEIKKDTVVYNPENYLDGTEKNVEDLLKKLPGIKVDENGSIQFKGKTVVALMIDGADLFNSNYMIGTKSINPKIIDQVEAIENWSDNPILKDLGAEKNVALNLKIKKEKISFSSTLNAETDFNERHHYGGYALVVNHLIKTFATANFNNVGINKSPINLSANSLSFQEYLNSKYQSPLIIENHSIDTQFGLEKTNRNEQWFTNANTIVKLGNKANLKIIGGVVKDKIRINSISENLYQINKETIYNKDENEIIKTPIYFTGDLGLKWHKSKKEYIEFFSTFNFLKENIENNLLSNSKTSYINEKHIENLFSKNELVYTLKLQKKNAIQIRALYTYNQKPQSLLITPSLPVFLTADLPSEAQQNVLSSKEFLTLESVFYHMFSENHKLKLSTGIVNQKFSLDTYLRVNNSFNLNEFDNKMYFKTNAFFVNLDYAFKNKNWDVKYFQTSQYYKQELNEKSKSNKTLFLNSLKINVLKNLFYKTAVFISADVNLNPINERYLFSNKVLVSNRRIISNTYDLDYEKQENYNFGFYYDDTYSSQFKAIISAGYAKSSNTLASKYSVTSIIDNTHFFRIKQPSQFYNVMLNIEKYISFIESRFNLKTTYVVSDYFSIINNNDLTKINSKSIQLNIIHQFAFNIPLKIKNDFDFVYTINQSKVANSNQNKFFSMKNSFVYSLFKNKFVFNFINEYYKPNIKQKDYLLFLNFGFHYSPKESMFKYTLSVNNLLNQKYNLTRYIQDYSVSNYKIQLMPRVFLAGINLSF